MTAIPQHYLDPTADGAENFRRFREHGARTTQQEAAANRSLVALNICEVIAIAGLCTAVAVATHRTSRSWRVIAGAVGSATIGSLLIHWPISKMRESWKEAWVGDRDRVEGIYKQLIDHIKRVGKLSELLSNFNRTTRLELGAGTDRTLQLSDYTSNPPCRELVELKWKAEEAAALKQVFDNRIPPDISAEIAKLSQEGLPNRLVRRSNCGLLLDLGKLLLSDCSDIYFVFRAQWTLDITAEPFEEEGTTYYRLIEKPASDS